MFDQIETEQLKSGNGSRDAYFSMLFQLLGAEFLNLDEDTALEYGKDRVSMKVKSADHVKSLT